MELNIAIIVTILNAVRDLIIIHPIEEIGILKELEEFGKCD